VLVLSCAICGVVGATVPQPQQVVQATSQPTQAPVTATTAPTQAPTATPKSTAKPMPKPSTSSGNLTPTFGIPLLGGRISDFIGKYGAPNSHTDAYSFHWFRDSSSNADGLIVWSLTHPKQVDSIDVQSVNGNMPDISSAVALCTVYNPDDAHQVKRYPLVDASGNNAGVDVVYMSASLAHKFSPDDFTDGNGNNVQPGLFDIQYLYKGDGTIDSCSILPGQEQTHL
jgi:hypothetical protein